MSANPFDDDNGGLLALVNKEEQRSLSLAFADVGAGQQFSTFDAADFAGGLQQVLVAMTTADPARRLSSVDFLDGVGTSPGWVVQPGDMANRLLGPKPALAERDRGSNHD